MLLSEEVMVRRLHNILFIASRERSLIRMEEWNENWETCETKDLYAAYYALSEGGLEGYPMVKRFKQFEDLLKKKNTQERATFLEQLHKDYRALLRRSIEGVVDLFD